MTETWRLQHLDHDIWQALSGARISQKRIDRVEDALVRREAHERFVLSQMKEYRQLAEDLRVHLRDRDAHIKNLEAELRPHIVAEEPKTESLL